MVCICIACMHPAGKRKMKKQRILIWFIVKISLYLLINLLLFIYYRDARVCCQTGHRGYLPVSLFLIMVPQVHQITCFSVPVLSCSPICDIKYSFSDVTAVVLANPSDEDYRKKLKIGKYFRIIKKSLQEKRKNGYRLSKTTVTFIPGNKLYVTLCYIL